MLGAYMKIMRLVDKGSMQENISYNSSTTVKWKLNNNFIPTSIISTAATTYNTNSTSSSTTQIDPDVTLCRCGSNVLHWEYNDDSDSFKWWDPNSTASGKMPSSYSNKPPFRGASSSTSADSEALPKKRRHTTSSVPHNSEQFNNNNAEDVEDDNITIKPKKIQRKSLPTKLPEQQNQMHKTAEDKLESFRPFKEFCQDSLPNYVQSEDTTDEFGNMEEASDNIITVKSNSKIAAPTSRELQKIIEILRNELLESQNVALESIRDAQNIVKKADERFALERSFRISVNVSYIHDHVIFILIEVYDNI
jgi:hypothetical protein